MNLATNLTKAVLAALMAIAPWSQAEFAYADNYVCVAGADRPTWCSGLGPNDCNATSGCNYRTYHGGSESCEGFPEGCQQNEDQISCINDNGCEWKLSECSPSQECPNNGCCVFSITGLGQCRDPNCTDNSDCGNGFRCVGARCDARCEPDPAVCEAPTTTCEDAKTLLKRCQNGITQRVTCPAGEACYPTGCTSEKGIPKGTFKDAGPAINESFGNKHYCSYQDNYANNRSLNQGALENPPCFFDDIFESAAGRS